MHRGQGNFPGPVGLVRETAFALWLERVALPPYPFENGELGRPCPDPKAPLNGACICYK